MRLNLLLVGFGNVARRFVRLLHEHRNRLAADYDLDVLVAGIATARHGAALNPAGVDIQRALDAVERGESLEAQHDSRSAGLPSNGLELIGAAAAARLAAAVPCVVVETTPLNIDDAQPALDHIRLAFLSRMHVVSANKGPVAVAHREVERLASSLGVLYRFEGAVMDGVPVFNLVRETMPAVQITGFRGVLNSTTNYILSALEDGEAFEAALADMQRQGIAEADASHDLDGWDAAAKAAALTNVLMNESVTPRDVSREGIRHVTGDRARDAVSRGRRLKLVASAARHSNELTVRVGLEELPEDDPLARLRGMSNALFLETDMLGRIGIVQLDGGLAQTAYALLSDLIAIRRCL